METFGEMMDEDGCEPHHPGNKLMFICRDNQKLRETAWQPKVSLVEGINDTASWW